MIQSFIATFYYVQPGSHEHGSHRNNNHDQFRFLDLIFEVVAFGKLSKIDFSLVPVYIGKPSKIDLRTDIWDVVN